MICAVVTVVILYCPIIMSRIVLTRGGFGHNHPSPIFNRPSNSGFYSNPKLNKYNMDHILRSNKESSKKINFNNFELFMEDDLGKFYRHDTPTQTLYFFKPNKNIQGQSYAGHHSKAKNPNTIQNNVNYSAQFFKPNNMNNFGSNLGNDFMPIVGNRLKNNNGNSFSKAFAYNFKNKYKTSESNEDQKLNNFDNNFRQNIENDDSSKEFNWIRDLHNPLSDNIETTIDHPIPNTDENSQNPNDGHDLKHVHGHAHSSQYIHRHVSKVQQVFFHENDHKSSTGDFDEDEDQHKKKEHKKHYDYHAHPKYKYGYKIEDTHTGDKKSHQEHRDGDVVKGHYEFKEPDGSTRTVHYHADKHTGFHADVKHKHKVVSRHHHLLEDYHH